MGRLPALILLLGAIACQSAADAPGAASAPAKSRVQAVLAAPGASAAERAPTAEPSAPAQPRPPLCQGQLAAKGRPFKPKPAPRQLGVEGVAALPGDPLRGAGPRWTWVNFWAAWCVPCKEELPLLLEWQRSLGAEVDFVFVSLDDDERQLREFLERQPSGGLKASYWLPDGATRQAWLSALNMTTEPELPLQLLLDPAGALRCRVEGAVEAGDVATLRGLVRQ